MERRFKRRTRFIGFAQYFKVWLSYRVFNWWRRKERILTLSIVWIYGNKISQKMGHYKHLCQHYFNWIRQKICWRVKNIFEVLKLHQCRQISSQIGSFKNLKKRLFWMGSWRIHSRNIETRIWCGQQTRPTFGLSYCSF